MPKNRFFMVCYGIILVLLIIWLLSKVSFIFRPLGIAAQTLFLPFLLSGVLFYLFRPLIDFLHGRTVPRVLAILLLFVALIGIFTGLSIMVGPVLHAQLNNLMENAPRFAEVLKNQWEYVQANRELFPESVNQGIEQALGKVQQIFLELGRNLMGVMGAVTSFVVTLAIVPFILFYMLKDGDKAPDQLLNFLPKDQKKEALSILSGMNSALSTYVQGQVIVSLCVGIMVYIGYLFIGIDYSLILALVAMFTNVIPFVGPFLGVFPALIVGIMDSPAMLLKVIIVVVIAQQIDSNLISPQIMGRALDVHPLTIILLLLVAGSLGGVLGLILAVPAYAVVKVVVKHAYRLIRLHYGY